MVLQPLPHASAPTATRRQPWSRSAENRWSLIIVDLRRCGVTRLSHRSSLCLERVPPFCIPRLPERAEAFITHVQSFTGVEIPSRRANQGRLLAITRGVESRFVTLDTATLSFPAHPWIQGLTVPKVWYAKCLSPLHNSWIAVIPPQSLEELATSRLVVTRSANFLEAPG